MAQSGDSSKETSGAVARRPPGEFSRQVGKLWQALKALVGFGFYVLRVGTVGIWRALLWKYTNLFILLTTWLAVWVVLPVYYLLYCLPRPSGPLTYSSLLGNPTYVLAAVLWLLLVAGQLAYWFFLRPMENDAKSEKPADAGKPPVAPAGPVAKSASATDSMSRFIKEGGPTKPDASKEQVTKGLEQLQRRIKAFEASLRSRPSVQLDDAVAEVALRGDVDPALALVFRPEGEQKLPPWMTLEEDGRLRCLDCDKLRGVERVAVFAEAALAPSMVKDLSEAERTQLRPSKFKIEVSARLLPANQPFLNWYAGTAKVTRLLPNAKQGVPCSFNVREVMKADPANVRIDSVDGGASGLVWSPETGVLEGQPAVGNNHTILVVVACPKTPSLRRELTLLLTCTMDPEVEWLRIQRDEGDMPAADGDLEALAAAASKIRNAEAEHPLVPHPQADFGKPHRVRLARDLGALRVRYASVRGRSHIKDRKFREDHAGMVAFHEERALAIVVSDGAGSARLSRRGSEIVVHVALAGMREIGEAILADPGRLTEGEGAWLRSEFAAVVERIRSRIEFESEQIRTFLPSFADKGMYATFLGSLVLPLEGGHVVLSYAVGDGAIGIGRAPQGAGGLKSQPDHGEQAGQTLFILSRGADDASLRLRVDRVTGPFSLILMTDGVTDPRLSEAEIGLVSRWDSLADELAGRDAGASTQGEVEVLQPFPPLVQWLEQYDKGHHDDRTVACVFHQPAS